MWTIKQEITRKLITPQHFFARTSVAIENASGSFLEVGILWKGDTTNNKQRTTNNDNEKQKPKENMNMRGQIQVVSY